MIRHAALFRLIHAPGSEAESGFLRALAALATIPGVQDFAISREVSTKNPYAFAVAMKFADQAAYDVYDANPAHTAFVQDRWLTEVAEFMEHDTTPL
jgi:hypothetical protein